MYLSPKNKIEIGTPVWLLDQTGAQKYHRLTSRGVDRRYTFA